MSKREQAALDFVHLVRNRMGNALVRYFMSHGVYVRQHDLSDAVALQTHWRFIETVARDIEVTNKAIKLATDLGTISLAEKEKAMLAVYSIEKKCASNLGQQGALETKGDELSQAVNAWPAAPSLKGPFLAALIGALCLYFNWGALGIGLLIAAFAFGTYRMHRIKKLKASIEQVVAEINRRFDSLLTVEISMRPSLPAQESHTTLKAAGLAAVALASAGFGWVSNTPQFQSSQPAAEKTARSTTPSRSSRENLGRKDATSPPLARQTEKSQSGARTNAETTTTRTPTRPAISASFDCTKARSNAERIICGDAQLANADLELAALFAKAKAAATDQDTFRTRARAAWTYRESNCHDRECLVRWYADQGTVLRRIAETGDSAAD